MKMIKDANSRFDNYSISPKISPLFFFVDMKMSYYWFNRPELLQKTKKKNMTMVVKKKLPNIIKQIKMS